TFLRRTPTMRCGRPSLIATDVTAFGLFDPSYAAKYGYPVELEARRTYGYVGSPVHRSMIARSEPSVGKVCATSAATVTVSTFVAAALAMLTPAPFRVSIPPALQRSDPDPGDDAPPNPVASTGAWLLVSAKRRTSTSPRASGFARLSRRPSGGFDRIVTARASLPYAARSL